MTINDEYLKMQKIANDIHHRYRNRTIEEITNLLEKDYYKEAIRKKLIYTGELHLWDTIKSNFRLKTEDFKRLVDYYKKEGVSLTLELIDCYNESTHPFETYFILHFKAFGFKDESIGCNTFIENYNKAITKNKDYSNFLKRYTSRYEDPVDQSTVHHLKTLPILGHYTDKKINIDLNYLLENSKPKLEKGSFKRLDPYHTIILNKLNDLDNLSKHDKFYKEMLESFFRIYNNASKENQKALAAFFDRNILTHFKDIPESILEVLPKETIKDRRTK